MESIWLVGWTVISVAFGVGVTVLVTSVREGVR